MSRTLTVYLAADLKKFSTARYGAETQAPASAGRSTTSATAWEKCWARH
jgi:hypothetical protein